MMDEPHDVVKLLVARMESHPEEFSSDEERFSDRWERYISDVEAFGNEADKAALNAKLRDIWMVKIHERVLDELMNGPERRRKEREDAEYERHLAHAARQQQTAQHNILLTKHQMAQQAQGALNGAYANQLSSSLGQLKQASAQGLVGKSYTSAIMDEYDYDLDKYRTPTGSILPVANGGTGNTLTNTINQIKQLLGAKK